MNALLKAFRTTFEGSVYRHRDSTLGDRLAAFLYDDLRSLEHSALLVGRIDNAEEVVNTRNRITGRDGRRGDGTFGQLIPGATWRTAPPYTVKRGPVATLRIGTEVKIVGTKKLAQIDRVITDLNSQADTFRTQTKAAITVGIAGVNFAGEYTSYEAERVFAAKYPPSRDAPEVVRKLRQLAAPAYDELLILRFKATNRAPFLFEWVNEQETTMEYNSALVRISNEYDDRFA